MVIDSIGRVYPNGIGRRKQGYCKRGHLLPPTHHKKRGCEKCQKIYYQEQRQERIDKGTARRLNVTVDMVQQHRKDHTVCEICGAKPTRKSLSIDHNHDTGQLRGSLCEACNLALGGFRDNPELLKSAIDYLMRWGK